MASETVVAPSLELTFIFAVAADDDERVTQPPSPADFSREPEPIPELSVFRAHTIAVLRRYFELSMATGRVPSLCGREFFRTNTQIRPHAFEDAVHFVIDVERCLQALDPLPQQLIVRIFIQDYSWEQAARLVGICRRKVADYLPGSIDQLTEMLLAKKILNENGRKR
jgi:hypothetical protein